MQALSGSMVFVSLALAWLVSPYWLLLTAFGPADEHHAAGKRKNCAIDVHD